MRLTSIVLLLVVAGSGLAGCGRRTRGSAPPAPRATAARESTSHAEALGPPIGRGDRLINAIAPKLAPWVAMWRQASPSFALDSLRRQGASAAFRNGSVEPMSEIRPESGAEESAFSALSIDAPGGRYTLVIDRYQAISESPTGFEIGGEPDSSPLLLDRGRSTSNAFDFCGTMCGFHWGAWIDSTRFVLAGWNELEQDSHRTGAFLSVYSLADSTQTRYLTRAVSSADWTRYRDAWQAWVETRYRALKAPRPRT